MSQIKYGARIGYDGELVIEKFTVKETSKTYKVSVRCSSLGWGNSFPKSELVPWGDTPLEAYHKLLGRLREKAEIEQETANYYLNKYQDAARLDVNKAKLEDKTKGET